MRSSAFKWHLTLLLAFNLLPWSQAQTPFITTWQTTHPNESIWIPVKMDSNYLYAYTIDWGDGHVTPDHTGNALHTYQDPGIYQVSISGIFPAISFVNSSDENSEKLIGIDQWGSQEWLTMEGAFYGCQNIFGDAVDVPELSFVRNMSGMFQNTRSIGTDITDWDVSKVTDMSYLFADADTFYQDIGNWDVSNVTNMSYMFYQARAFNQDIGNWDVSNVTNMSYMFNGAKAFKKDIGAWDVSNVMDMSNMFLYARTFNQDLGNWDVGNVTNMSFMFGGATLFNQDIGNWDVSHVEDMSGMFDFAQSFNQDLGNWDVSHVKDMSWMFACADHFNGDISDWDVSRVRDMKGMFAGSADYGVIPFIETAFNRDISRWDVGNVTNMSWMFYCATAFDQNIGEWDVRKVTNMESMFRLASSFDQDIGNWEVGNVMDMSWMFASGWPIANQFDQDIGAWDVSRVVDMGYMFGNTHLSTTHYDALLNGWSMLALYPGIEFDGGLSTYCEGNSARQYIIDHYGWEIKDGGLDCTTAVEELADVQNPIEVFPNPTSGVIHLPAALPLDQIGRIRAWDALGQEHPVRWISDRQYHMSIQGGLYIVVLEMKDGRRYVDKVMVER